MTERRVGCPVCKRNMLYRKDDLIKCACCDWEGAKARREEDRKLPTFIELRKLYE
jgi:ribosomal protein L37AE/L43A